MPRGPRAIAVLGSVVVLAAVAAGSAGAAESLPAYAQGHPYRHGVVPVRPGSNHMGANTTAAAAGSGNLSFGGGTQGVGVTTGAPRVYLVFWGSQWGSRASNSQGYVTLSGDPDSIAPMLQGFFSGLGTGGEQWSGVMTQYCEGVPAGSQSCSATAAHVGYPTGGALAGVWVEMNRPPPPRRPPAAK